MTVVPVQEIQTLERAIERELNLGQKDPHQVYERLEDSLGPEELLRLAMPYIPDLVSEMARHKLGQKRRQAIAKISDKSLTDPEIMLKSLWIPTKDGKILYKRIADMDDRDFDARAAYLERLVLGISRHAMWCREVAAMMRKHKAVVARDLLRLPELPEVEA